MLLLQLLQISMYKPSGKTKWPDSIQSSPAITELFSQSLMQWKWWLSILPKAPLAAGTSFGRTHTKSITCMPSRPDIEPSILTGGRSSFLVLFSPGLAGISDIRSLFFMCVFPRLSYGTRYCRNSVAPVKILPVSLTLMERYGLGRIICTLSSPSQK